MDFGRSEEDGRRKLVFAFGARVMWEGGVGRWRLPGRVRIGILREEGLIQTSKYLIVVRKNFSTLLIIPWCHKRDRFESQPPELLVHPRTKTSCDATGLSPRLEKNIPELEVV